MAKVTLKGGEVNTVGVLPNVGTELPDFELVAQDLSVKNLDDFQGKRKILNIFPSVDTGVCAASAREFNKEVTSLDNTVVINISKDLPFAIGRFCAAEGIDNVETLSDFRSSYGDLLGLTMTDSPLAGLLSRAVIVVDEDNTIVYTEQVPEITQEPNYEAAIASLI